MTDVVSNPDRDDASPRRRVLVTGATGFIGRHLVSILMQDCDVVAVTRSPAPAGLGVRTLCVGEIDRGTRWDGALDGVDAVVHVAGLAHRGIAHQRASPDAYREVNARGTVALAAAAARHGVRDFIFLSSIAVNGSSSADRGPFTEGDTPRPKDAYGVSKAEAEVGLEEIAARSSLACTIIRPPLVYGRGAPGNVAMLTQALKRNVALPLASIKNARAFVSVASLVDFIVWRLARSNRGSETFIVADTGHVSTPVFISHLGAAIGLRPRLFRFPTSILSAGLRASGRASLAESMLSTLEVDISKVRNAGWVPLSDTGAGLVLAFAESTATSD